MDALKIYWEKFYIPIYIYINKEAGTPVELPEKKAQRSMELLKISQTNDIEIKNDVINEYMTKRKKKYQRDTYVWQKASQLMAAVKRNKIKRDQNMKHKTDFMQDPKMKYKEDDILDSYDELLKAEEYLIE